MKVEPLLWHGLFNNVKFTTFLGIESGNYIAVYGGVRELWFHQKYVLKLNEVPKGLKRHEGE